MDVVVIGAGLSGLSAASILRDAGARVQLLEAGAQIGGRIRSLHDTASGRAVADLGPTWVWPKYQPIVMPWLEKLGISTFTQFNTGNAVIEGYGSETIYQPLPGQDGMMRIVGGPNALVAALADRVGMENIRTSAPVSEVSANGATRMAVHLASGEVITTQRVIIAVPLRVAATTLHLPWAQEELTRAMRATPTWMSTQAKAVAVYQRPFWRDAGLSGRIASRTGPLFEAHDHTCHEGAPAAIFGFVGWPPDARRRDPGGLKKAILDQLCACFGQEAAQPVMLEVMDWAMNPHIVSDLDLSQTADHPVVGPAILRHPHLDGRVHLAVSEVSDLSPGLIEGALNIGAMVGAEVLGQGGSS